MFQRFLTILIILLALFTFTSCAIVDDVIQNNDDFVMEDKNDFEVILIEDLVRTENFRKHALEHILEGEINRRGQAVGFHYDRLPTKKGEIIAGTETEKNEFGIYEAEITVNDIKKTSNSGKSTFFPDEWNTQQVVDAINEAYEVREFISGNTYEGLTEEGIIIRMYLDDHDKIISAFPIYE